MLKLIPFILITSFASFGYADIPNFIWCSKNETDGSRLLYDFKILNEKSLDFDVKVVISVVRLLPYAWDTPPGSRDIRKLENSWFWGKRDPNIKNLIHLDESGFIKFNEGTDLNDSQTSMTYQTPNSIKYVPPYTPDPNPKVAPNCVIPEPKIGVGN